MEEKNNNLLLYGILAIVIIAAVSVYLYRVSNQVYSISVDVKNITTTRIYPYQTIHLNVTIGNRGAQVVSGMFVNLYSNNSEVGSYKVSLPAHTNTHIIANYTYKYSGNYSFKAVADPAHVLNIADRNTTQSGIIITVLSPAQPEIYTSIPNNGINYTQSFTISSGGVALVSYIDNFYNLSVAEGMLGINRQIFNPFFSDIQGMVSNVNGAYAKYSNGEKAYVVWLQGIANNQTISTVLNTFRLKHTTSSTGGVVKDYYVDNSTTSICSFYQDGWTKVIMYYNASEPSTCLSVTMENYTPTTSSRIIAALKNNTQLEHYQTGFYYTNYSSLGSSIIDSNSTIGFVNLFQNSYGLFLSTVLGRTRAFDTNSNVTCAGLIYRNGTNNICSSYVMPIKTANASISLINTSELTANYIIELYSLVNTSTLLNAHYNGAHLINALDINESSVNFTSPFKNSCNLNNASIGCKVKSFNNANNTGVVSITNNFSSGIRIKSVACYMPGERVNETQSVNVTPSSLANLTVRCYNVPIPATSAVSSYTFIMNYTLLNRSRLAIGVLNVSNLAS